MTLSTYSAAETQLKENLLFDNSTSKASLALEAIRYMIAFRPNENTGGGQSFTFERLQDMETKAEAIVASGNSSNRASLVQGRMRD